MKNYKTFLILTWLSWCLPLGRIYLGRNFLLRVFTLNWFGWGFFTDIFYTRKQFDEAMAKRGFVNTDIRNNKGK